MELLTVKEVAAIFKVTPRTLRAWQKDKLLMPICKIKRSPRYLRQDIENLVFKSPRPSS